MTKQKYSRLYPTGLSLEKFYGTVKQHKLKNGSSVNHLHLRQVISSIRTASYQLAKYLPQLLSPLSKSQYTVTSTKKLIDTIKNERAPCTYKMKSFDVSSLFTMVLLDYTIWTKISRKDMKKLFLLCSKNVNFTFRNNIYRQKIGVVMGSLLGPVFAGIFMVHLERILMS